MTVNFNIQYTFEGKACYGLALGYVMDSISLSLEGQNWNDPIVVIKMDDSDVEVRHISILYWLTIFVADQPDSQTQFQYVCFIKNGN